MYACKYIFYSVKVAGRTQDNGLQNEREFMRIGVDVTVIAKLEQIKIVVSRGVAVVRGKMLEWKLLLTNRNEDGWPQRSQNSGP